MFTKWKEETTLMQLEWDIAVAIMDDATCHGFEFKVENHTIYSREFLG